MISIVNLAYWIIANRRGKAFEGYSFWHIIAQLSRCIKDNSMLCIVEENKFVGIICGELRNAEKVYYVHDILTTKPGIVKQMLYNFSERFPDYTIKGKHRTGRDRNFTNIPKLTNRLYGS